MTELDHNLVKMVHIVSLIPKRITTNDVDINSIPTHELVCHYIKERRVSSISFFTSQTIIVSSVFCM
jgi:hypothetical protein